MVGRGWGAMFSCPAVFVGRKREKNEPDAREGV